jgi:hypothetical protein
MYIAARRMKGVVSPQHAPTKRNPRIQRKMDGCGSSVRGGFGSIIDTTKLVSERKFRVYRIQKIVQVLSGHSMHAIGVVFVVPQARSLDARLPSQLASERLRLNTRESS